MDDSLALLATHGYAAIFVLILADQAGLPFPGEILLVGAGALCSRGGMSLPLVFGLAVVAALAADFLWYEMGRRKGARVLGFLCRLSLEPDSCVRDTETLFERRGPVVLVIAKFVPGLSTVAPPLAGMLRTDLRRFLLLDLAGCALWVGAFLGPGYLFGEPVARALEYLTGIGAPLAVIALSVVAGYVGWKFLNRWRILRRLRTARVAPDDVRRRLDAGEALFVVDLRNALDYATDPRTLPGARRIAAEELVARHAEIPRDRDIILYCT